MKKLKESGVVFNEENHTYTLDGDELSGITGYLKRLVFPDLYRDVPHEVLEEAARRGTLIHRQIEDFAVNGNVPMFPSDELTGFANFASIEKIKFVSSEYLVTDFDHFASAIDLVDDNNNLYDIKTTASLNREYCSWQLSIYKYLFKCVNGCEAGDIYAIHCTADCCKAVKLDEIPREVVVDFLIAAASGVEIWDNPLKTNSIMGVEAVEEIEVAIADFEAKIKALKEQRENLVEFIKSEMKARGIVKFDTPRLSFTIKAPYERTSVDSTKLKKDYPEIYENCKKTSTVAESLLIKIKESDAN